MNVELHGGPYDGMTFSQKYPAVLLVMGIDDYGLRRGSHLTDDPVLFDYLGLHADRPDYSTEGSASRRS